MPGVSMMPTCRRARWLSLWLAPALALAQSDEAELALAFGDAQSISIATGSAQPLRLAPAVGSVFTAEQIRALGLRDLHEVLNLVPGLNIARSALVYEPQDQFRGAWNTFNQQVLYMVDGVALRDPYYGRATNTWVYESLDNIERIEVIRGPGSALYGADAFTGVISITTKTGAGLRGTQLNAEVGSFAGRRMSLLHGQAFGDWQWRLHLGAERSDGARNLIETDAQSVNDARNGTQVSLAPGPINRAYAGLDARLAVQWQRWQLQSSYRFRGVGLGQGLAGALDPIGWLRGRDTTTTLSYAASDWQPHWDLQAHLSRYHQDSFAVVQLFPPGAFGGFPQGVIGEPGRQMTNSEAEGQATYKGWQGHQLRIGAGVRRAYMNHVIEYKNFDQPVLGPLVPVGAVQPATAQSIYIVPSQRRAYHLLLQDEWNVAKDWRLTTGLRHDHDSQFGGVTIPRIALVWEAAYNLSLKLLHGRAFRAPAFVELYVVNNPAYFGNPNLAPERMATHEAVLDWQISPQLQTSFNLFHYRIKDFVRFVPLASDPTLGAKLQNLGSLTGQGFEWESQWTPSPAWRVRGSLSYQRSTDQLNHHDTGAAPRWMAKVMADWQVAPGWSAHTQVRHIAGRQRPTGDDRPRIADYTWLDASLQWQGATLPGWRLNLALRNLFNADARDPSPGSPANDLPLPGRHAWLAASYNF